MSEFRPTNKEDTCLWCGKKLGFICNTVIEVDHSRPPRSCSATVYEWGNGISEKRLCKLTVFTKSDEGWRCEKGHVHPGRRFVRSRERRFEKPGFGGNGFFCSTQHGYYFGRAFARLGRRLEPPKK